MAAIVTGTYDMAPLSINVALFRFGGSMEPLSHLAHASLPRHEGEPYWDWMDYQKGQAAKTEALEAQLKEKATQRHERFNHDTELGKLQAGAPSPVDGKR